jgi:hypothetical protein
MTFIKYFSFIFCLLSIVACDPENFFTPIVDVNLPPHKSKLVLFANFQGGSDSLVVHLTRSRSALDTTKVGVTDLYISTFNGVTDTFIVFTQGDTLRNAKVELFRNDALWGTFKVNKGGKYVLRQKLPADGATYRIRAELAGYDVVEATQKMPTAGILDSARYVKNGAIIQDPFGSYKADEYTFFFKDAAEIGSYYKVEAVYFSDTTNNYPNFIYYLNSLDKLSQSDFLGDKSFNGKAYSWRNSSSGFTIITNKGSRIEYTLFTTTADLFQFTRSKELNNNAQGNPFAEPTILYSNIKNGYGLFSLTTTSTWIKRF